MDKVYRINTSTKEIKLEKLKEEYKYFGGRGLIAKIMLDEVNPKCDPLGEENKLIINTGLFAGTNVPTAHRLSIGGKSPLTGGIKEANAGGTAGTLLAKHGIKMIIVEDSPTNDEWYVIKVNSDSSVELLPADEYVSLNNYDLVEKVKEKYGDKTSVISIGVAGERQYKNSSIQVTDNATGHPARAAGRGGLGALMGSKKIKAIIIEKALNPSKFNYVDEELFKESTKTMVNLIKSNPLTGEGLPMVGTPLFADFTAPDGALPVKNFSGEKFDRIEEIDSKSFLTKMSENGGKTGVKCQPGCIIGCSNIYKNGKGEFVTSGLEYETLAMFGPNCDISDWDAIAEFDRLCDDFGVDTIEMGNTIALCMESGKLAWGDKQGALNLVREMMEGTKFGDLLGAGTETVGKTLGVQRIPTVKGQALAAYDPRNLKGTGVTYATSTMGADHTCGCTVGKPVNHYGKEGQVDLSRELQIAIALCDNMLCLFGFGGISDSPENLSVLVHLMTGAYGGDWSLESLMEIGINTIKVEKEFNKLAGFTSKDDKLPDFLYTEETPSAGTVFDITEEELTQTLNFAQTTSDA